MLKPNLKLYFILIVILIVLFILVLIIPYGKREEKIQPTPTPLPTNSTDFNPLPPIKLTPTIIHPTSTGASEDVPPETLNFAIQKQNLKKMTPLTQKGFTVTFDYSNDIFIVALSAPKDTSRQAFNSWLKQTYPAVPITKFIFK